MALLRRVMPAEWLADPVTAKPGAIRRMLKKLGPTWLSSPVRRIAQALCLVAFIALFLYVCWPYSARPVRAWKNFTPLAVDAMTGQVTLTADTIPNDLPPIIHLNDDSAADPAAAYLGAFRVTARAGVELMLAPQSPPSAQALEVWSFSLGPWSIHEARPGSWPSHYADTRAARERIHAETFLIIDPLVSISTAIAARAWVWSLVWAIGILLVCILIPRGFCGYVCPLGTVIDLFDWAIGKRITRFRVADEGWWVHVKYYLLAAVLMASLGGVLISGFVAAIPVITRAMLFIIAPFQDGAMRGWHLVPPINAGQVFSIVLFLAVLGLGLFKPRFWCKYVCPSGAVFSLGNLFRATERKVEATCINCNKCYEVCPFDAIKPDYTTRTTDCTLCQTCAGVCPTHAIKFVERTNVVQLKIAGDPPTNETPLGRRGFLAAGAGIAAAVTGAAGVTIGTKAFGANLDDPAAFRPVRPPGSVPEQEFLQLCIRCGECFKACPNNVLQPLGFQQGLEGLWTPQVAADWAGCESSCNNCGQVCPTGAIRPLPLEEKKVARMGLAIVDERTCLPHAGREACQLCVDECVAAGYDAIEFMRVGTQADDLGNPIEGSGFIAPVVKAERCVGCGLCQTRCYGINVQAKGLLHESAIIIKAGQGREDRMMHGSYIELRHAEQQQREAELQKAGGSYLPEFIK